MNAATLETALAGLPLGPLRYLDRVGSTNDEASRWTDAGAPDMALVVADEQTAGRGRQGRKWFTPPGSALAFSLVLKGLQMETSLPSLADLIPRLTGLGALAVCAALRQDFQLAPQIKWPNDVLLEHRKVAGILAEAHWQGDQLKAVILGIGINIAPESVPPAGELIFPATCVEEILGRPVSRTEFLRTVLANLIDWRMRLDKPEFLRSWEENLAFRGEWVTVSSGADSPTPLTQQGQVLGLDQQGQLRLVGASGETFTVLVGDVRLRS